MPQPNEKFTYWESRDGLILLEGWTRRGLTDKDIAKNCGIAVKTLYDWKNKHPRIREALKKGKEVIDLEVENALLKRALGFDYDEVTEEESSEGGYKRKVVHKKVVGDVGAQAFWLKNRRPDLWRDKPEVPTDPESLKKAKELLDNVPSVID